MTVSNLPMPSQWNPLDNDWTDLKQRLNLNGGGDE